MAKGGMEEWRNGAGDTATAVGGRRPTAMHSYLKIAVSNKIVNI